MEASLSVMLLALLVLAPALLAASPVLPVEAKYSPALLGQWCRAAGLANQERLAVESIAAKWEARHDAWRLAQEARIIRAMERTWKLPDGSVEREQAAAEVWRLQKEKVERRNLFVAEVRKLVTLRGTWTGQTA